MAHDSHNLILVGTNDPDILKAIEKIRSMGGGMAVVSDREGPGFPSPSHCGSHVEASVQEVNRGVREDSTLLQED